MTVAGYPRYESYKDSGVEWIGEIPAHWEVQKLGTLLSSVSERNQPGLPLLSITREEGVIERNIGDSNTNHNFIPDDLNGYKVLRKGQFGINKMKAWQGSYGVSEFTGIVSPAYFIFNFKKKTNNSFFNIAVRSKLYISLFGSASDGVRVGQWDLNQTRMYQIPFLTPPLAEQRDIATFLEEKCAKIDEAIRIKEEQIKLLHERRQILIQQAVTRGLNPGVPMKDSGIDWIGQIPAHWETRRLKMLSRVKRGASPRPIDDPKYFSSDGKYAWVRIKDVTASTHYLEKTEQKLSNLGASLSVKLQPGNIFLSIAGSVGKPMITSIYCCIHDGFVYFPDYGHSVEYLFDIFETGSAFHGLGKLGTQLNLNTDTVGNIYIPLPPGNEQNQITEHTAYIREVVDSTIFIKQSQITALKEYKTTLINAAVTGKIRITPDMLSTSAN